MGLSWWGRVDLGWNGADVELWEVGSQACMIERREGEGVRCRSIDSKRKRRRSANGLSRQRRVSDMNRRTLSHCVRPGLRRIDFGAWRHSDHRTCPDRIEYESDQRSLAAWTAKRILVGPRDDPVGPGLRDSGRRRRCRAQQLPTTGQLGVDVSAGQDSIVTNADEAWGQDVEQKASEELLRRQAHHF